MITVTEIVGNIFDDKKLMAKFKQMESQKKCERLKTSRLEMERSRIRKKTDLGTDIGLVLDSGVILRHGDVLAPGQKFIMIEQLAEKVLVIKIKKLEKKPIELVTIGHTIGNRHKPIRITDDSVVFPIQSDTEVEIFEKLLSSVIDKIELKVEEQIFQPQHGMYMHEH
jgi:urease accessory protein